MKCPVCSTINLNMSDRQGVEIDYCPQCRGVWLDRGELDKLIERAQQTAVASGIRPASQYVQPPRQYEVRTHGVDDQRHRTHKKKSFLGEIFDFD